MVALNNYNEEKTLEFRHSLDQLIAAVRCSVKRKAILQNPSLHVKMHSSSFNVRVMPALRVEDSISLTTKNV